MESSILYVTKKLAFICYSYHVIIEAVNQSLTDYQDVNITVTDEEHQQQLTGHEFSLGL